MSITAVPNSPIGWSDAHQSALQPKDSRYCQPWGVTPAGVEHDMRFQLRATKTGYDLSEGGAFVPYYTGVTTSVGASQIIDSGAAFATPPAQSQHIAVNTTTGEQTTLDAPPVAGLTALDINDDIFDAGTLGNGYAVVALRLPIGSVLYNGTDETVAFSLFVSENSFIIEDFFPNTTDRFVVEVDIADYAGGVLEVLAGGYPVTFSALDQTAFGTGNGTYSFYGIPSGLDLKIQDTSTESNYTITGIRIYYASVAEVYVYEDGVEIDQINPTQYIHDRALFTVDILSYGIGCYTLYANSVNGLVGSSTFPLQVNPPWTIANAGTGWSFVANELVHTAAGGVGTNTATYVFEEILDGRCNYVIEFNISSGDIPQVFLVTPAFDLNVSAYLTTGTNYINVYGMVTTGVRFELTEVDGTAIDSFNVYNTFYNEIGIYASPSTGLVELTAFRVAPDFCTPQAFVCLPSSADGFVLYSSTITNDSASPVKKKDRWLPASADYTEYVWLPSNVRFGRYQDDDFETYRDSNGRGRLVYSDRVKVQECQIAPVPVWVHDWMSWATRNTFEVNGVEYYLIDGNYSPNWQRDSPNASAIFEIAKQNQDIKTTGCD